MINQVDHLTMTQLSGNKDRQQTVQNNQFQEELGKYNAHFLSGKEEWVLSSENISDMEDRHVPFENVVSFARTLIAAQALDAEHRPKDFLRALNSEELQALQVVHGLKKPIDIASLDDEGARNLLVQPGDATDSNGDGLVATGEMLSWTFPPQGAPESVKQAWKEAMASHTLLEHTLKVAPFLSQQLAANTRFDANGNPEGLNQQTDGGFTAIYGQDPSPYLETANNFLQNHTPQHEVDLQNLNSERESFIADFASRLENAKI